MNGSQEMFNAVEVCEMAQIKRPTLNNWLRTGAIKGLDGEAGSQGRSRMFTRDDAIAVIVCGMSFNSSFGGNGLHRIIGGKARELVREWQSIEDVDRPDHLEISVSDRLRLKINIKTAAEKVMEGAI